MNLYAQFKKILPQKPRVAGEIISVTGGVSKIETVHGDQFLADGNMIGAGKVLVEDGAVKSEITDLENGNVVILYV